MAVRYWVGGTGNWLDAAHWSASSGGVGGETIPTSSDDVCFDANSFSGAGQIVTINATAYCKDMNWAGATNNPTLAGSSALNIYGSLTAIAGMSAIYTGDKWFNTANQGQTITTGGISWPGRFLFNGDGSWVLQDNLTSTTSLNLLKGTFDTNNKNISVTFIDDAGSNASKTLMLGNSSIYCTGFGPWALGTLTLTPNTATINCSGNFAGGGINTYQIVNLTGANPTISGSNTFARLALPSGTTQTITFTDGTTQTITSPRLSGSSGHIHTLQGSGTGGWALAMPAGFVGMDYLSVSRSTVSPAGTWYAGAHSSDGGNNTGWVFGDLTAASPPAALDAVAPAPTPSAAALAAAAVGEVTAGGLIPPGVAADALAAVVASLLDAAGFAPALSASALAEASPATVVATGTIPSAISAGATAAAVQAAASALGLTPELFINILGRILAHLQAYANINAQLRGGGEE